MNVTSVVSGLVTQLDVSRDVQREAAPRAQAQRTEPVMQSEPKHIEGRESKPQVINSSQKRDLERIGNAFNKKLQFVVDHGSNEVLVKVIDKETDKVIKVIPPEELQRLHRNLKEAIGNLFSEMV